MINNIEKYLKNLIYHNGHTAESLLSHLCYQGFFCRSGTLIGDCVILEKNFQADNGTTKPRGPQSE